MKRRVQKDNRGSTLVMLVVAFSFLAILGTIITSVTMMNARVKLEEKKEKSSFYRCEVALDRIKVGLETMVTDKMRNSYQMILVEYTSYENAEKVKDVFYDETIQAVKKTFNATNPVVSGTDIQSLLEQYIRNKGLEDAKVLPSEVDDIGVAIGKNASFRILNHSIVISNIVVTDKNYSGLNNSITTDIRIELPDVNVDRLKEIFDANDIYYKEYAIIASKGICYCSAEAISRGVATVIGNVFAGKDGILVKGDLMQLNLFGEQLVVEGNLESWNQATIEVGSIKDRGTLWANNILTKNDLDSSKDTSIKIGGRSLESGTKPNVLCCVKDDLSLGAKNSNVFIKGQYAGYTKSLGLEGSAITVNGGNARLDLSQVSKLALAGYAHITDEKGDDILRLGESVGIKNNQIIYLVPNEYMKRDRNPILKGEYDIDGETSVNLALVHSVYGKDTTIKKLVVQTVEGSTMVYFYLEFSDEAKTVKHLERYIGMSHGTPWYELGKQAYMAREVKLCDPSYIYTVGNVVDYKRRETGYYQNHLSVRPYEDVSMMGNVTVSQMKEYHKQLIHTLQYVTLDALNPIPPVVDTSKNAFEYVIDCSKLTKEQDKVVTTSYRSYDSDLVPAGEEPLYEVKITGGDVVISNSMKGVIVANGDVTVNADFTGIILSNGTVRIGAGVTICRDSNVLNEVLACNDESINSYFVHAPQVSKGKAEGESYKGIVDLANLVTFENWKKR